ncbi:MAG TPA: hypothetical protein VK762_37835, partial [Polyangiaceae bacterium]|nr:hypothetical protein [Polyangiaceae bacterium]
LAIGHAEEEIDHLLPSAAGRGSPKKGGSKAEPVPLTTAAPKTDADKDAEKDEAKRGPGTGVESCSTACRALASLVSSAERLCKLAGENDGRCDDARARARGATARVKSSCSSCSVSMAAPPPPAPTRDAPPPGPAPGMPGSSTSGLPLP